MNQKAKYITLLLLIPCSFPSSLLLSSGVQKETSESHNDVQVNHESETHNHYSEH